MSMLDKKILLVTGATGFVGSHFVERMLTESDYQLRCLVRDKNKLNRLTAYKDKIQWVIGDITDAESLVAAVDGVWGVVNLAGYREFWSRQSSHYYSINEQGAKNVFMAALEAGVEKAVQVSTPLAFGVPEVIPFNENSSAGKHPNRYGHSKYCGDNAAWKLHQQAGLPLSIVYLAAVIGAGDDKATMEVGRAVEGKMPALVGADTTYTYVYLGDAVEAIAQAVIREETIGERYLIGTERATTREYFNLIGDFAGVSMPDLNIPELILMPIAYVMEMFSRVSGVRPMLPIDVLKTTAAGSLLFDGSKAQKALEINYTPLSSALAESVQEIQQQTPDAMA
ncbi:MAG: NAD-dependent epimerase/dehydratase family protein [Pseudomonadales bacterium]|nr:NAD-dependent epimerase/dehydratase family protein [Pseudomonadales bacterium]